MFKKGLRVRVAHEHILHKLRLSQIGEVVGHKDGEVCVQLEEALAPVVIPAEILVSNAEAPKYKDLRTFLRTSHEIKRAMLRVIGISDPIVDNIEVINPKVETLSDAQIDTFAHVCRWALDLDEVKEVQVAPCKLVGLLLEGHLGFGMGSEDPEAHKKILRVFRRMLKVSKKMLIPIRGIGKLSTSRFLCSRVRRVRSHVSSTLTA